MYVDRGAGRNGGSPGLPIYSAGRAAGVVAVMLALSACMLDVDKPDLAIDLPQRYKEASGAVEAAVPPLDWWRTFRSGELTSLVQQASTANLGAHRSTRARAAWGSASVRSSPRVRLRSARAAPDPSLSSWMIRAPRAARPPRRCPARHHRHTRGRGRKERCDLGRGERVVQEHEHPPVGQ